ncbi:MAG TPA: ABC transporter permease, partial [Flavisolibacter sp.]|nr:ABC transporter permease [Flavisolibacter sp.]
MLSNYFKVAFRYLAKHKGYTFINILGLAVGIACCILVMLFVRSEWSFDRFHAKADRIHRAWLQEFYQGEIFNSAATPIPLGPVLSSNLPEADAICRAASVNPQVTYNNNTFNEPVAMVDSNFFEVFDFRLVTGERSTVFSNANSIVITERTAKKYFGAESAAGKNLQLQLGDDKVLFTVTGVLEDLPLESSLQFEMLIPFSNAPYIYSEAARSSAWSNVSVQTYVLLKEGAAVDHVNGKIATIMNPLVAKNYKPGQYNVRLQPLKDIHFNSTLPQEMDRDSNPKYSYILASIGILVLLIACINFVTLSIGRSTTRALEVGVRKVLGAGRRQLIGQFWGESLLLTLLSLIAGVLLALVLLKPFNELAGRELDLPFDGFTILFCLAIVCIIGLVAGIYPAIVLSGFKPIQVLKGRLVGGSSMGFFRRALVVGQFVASIIMIIATINVNKQLDYLQTKDLGYNREHLVVVPTNLPGTEGRALAARFKNALSGNPQIISSTSSLYSMANYGWMQLGFTDKQNVFRQFNFNAVDVDFLKTMGLQIVQGRAFQDGNAADSNTIIVNEALVRQYGWKDPLGRKLPGAYEQEIIGVVKDFHLESLHSPINPAVIALKPDSIFSQSTDMSYATSPRPRVSVRFKEGSVQEHVAILKAAWASVAGDLDFEYVFLDEALATAYAQEQRLGNIVKYASVLSIFIACMGLFGLATLVVVRRTKEIGIRKVLGADVRGIVGLLSKDFIVLVLIASLIAFPVAWWALNDWLQDFAFRIPISLWVFLAAALLTMTVA